MEEENKTIEQGQEQQTASPAADDKDKRISELEAELESLKSSFEAALEEMALKNSNLEAEPEIEEEEEEEPEAEEPPKAPEEPQKENIEEPDVSLLEEKLESAIKEDENFRETVLLNQEKLELKLELDKALEKYPEADPNEVLLNIEEGVEEGNPNQVEILAKMSQEKRLAERQNLEKKIEAELKQKFEKEIEGSKFVPQAPGSAPKLQETQDTHGGFKNEDIAWGEALAQAKQLIT